ncbi:MAG: tetratricopeptide repeat protein, partial [bacterium]
SGRCGEALDRLKAFLDRYAGHDNGTLARFALGRCAAKAGEEALALEHLGRVARDEEDRAGVRSRAALLQAALLLRKGKLREAEKALGVAVLSADPEIAVEALFSRADLLARRKDPRAGAEFLKLTYRYPDRRMWAARALGRAGELYESAGRRATAIRIFQKMRKVAPPGALRTKAEATLRRLGKAPGPRR